MPLRSWIHSSVVSTMRDSMWLSTQIGGTATPVPRRRARGCGIGGGSLENEMKSAGRLEQRPALRERQRVEDGEVAVLDEAVDRRRKAAVQDRGVVVDGAQDVV